MPRGATARLFVAIDPPPAVCEALAEWARAAVAASEGDQQGRPGPAVRVLAPELMHLTICFLGSRPVGEISALAAAVRGCPAEPCQLRLGAPLWLPPRRPHALVIAIGDGDGALQRLHERAAGSLADASSWEPERRRFRPHVTVARMPARRMGGPSGTPLPATPAGTFSVSVLRLYRSHLSPAGASYEAIAEGAPGSAAV